MPNQSQPNKPVLTVNLLTYNSASDLEPFFASLRKQTFQNFQVIVIDNASTDRSIAKAVQLWPEATILAQPKNLGYTGGHNAGLNVVKTEYVLVANPDTVMADDFLSHLMAVITRQPRLGSVGGKLWRSSAALNNESQYGIIDSAGLAVYHNRRFIDRGQGEADRGQYGEEMNVFGISGALVLYRMAAVRQARLPNGQWFDERYFMYREDIDLAWRLQHFGWSARYIPQAQAWHRRTAAGSTLASDRHTARQRRDKSALVNFWSYRNHLYTLMKNERRADFVQDGLWIIWFELKKLVYLILFERSSLRAIMDVWRQRQGIWLDRRFIQSQGRCHMADWRK